MVLYLHSVKGFGDDVSDTVYHGDHALINKSITYYVQRCSTGRFRKYRAGVEQPPGCHPFGISGGSVSTS
jgi:hypothetical protein